MSDEPIVLEGADEQTPAQETYRPAPAAPLKRSWKRGDKTVGTYDAQFVFEGAVVQLKSLDDDAWDRLEMMEESLQQESASLVEFTELVADVEAKARTLRTKARETQDANDKAAADEAWDNAAALRRELTTRSKDAAKQLAAFQQHIVSSTVVGWSGGPIEYSPEAVEELPLEMVAQWSAIILEKSRIGRSDADFLRRS